uniref:Omega-hydroxypalmitate O-feruloyl transferase n=1 Tax=Leersia perrieri TaxID=77586 RepID=A0A0D9V9Q7_9ORYZ
MTRGQEAAMAGVAVLGVKRGEPTLVSPASETKSGLYYLSNLDQNIAVIVQTVYFFPVAAAGAGAGVDIGAGEVLRESLSRVLVHYYPLAGRLAVGEEGKLIVDCTGEGAVFVDAVAGCELADVGGDVTGTDSGVLGELVYTVTKFKCGGFVLGLAMNHCMFDGVAAMQFVSSWAEITRSPSPSPPLSLPPSLDRSVLRPRHPPLIQFPHHEFAQIDDDSSPFFSGAGDPILHRSFHFTPNSISRIKSLVSGDELGEFGDRRPTTFEALAGFVWSARTAAVGIPAASTTKLLFAVDGRPRFTSPPLPEGYSGNAIVLTSAACAADELTSSLSRAAAMVRAAAEKVDDAYMRSAVDYIEAAAAATGGRPRRPSLASTLLITAWSRLPFAAADFGWGPPSAYGPAALPEREVALFLSAGGGGVRVLLGLPAAAMAEFELLVDEVIVD